MEKNKQPFDFIIKFLLNPHDKENKKGLEILYKIFIKEFNKFDILKKYTTASDLFSEFLIDVLFKEKGFKLNPTLHKKIYSEKINIVSYIYRMMYNFLITKHREFLTKYFVNEGKVKERFLSISTRDKDDKEKNFFDKDQQINYVIIIEAQEIHEFLEKELSYDEKRTLCYMFSNDELVLDKNVSKDAIYKRKSRLKQKLSKIIQNKGFSIEGFTYYISNILLSEICPKIRYIDSKNKSQGDE